MHVGLNNRICSREPLKGQFSYLTVQINDEQKEAPINWYCGHMGAGTHCILIVITINLLKLAGPL